MHAGEGMLQAVAHLRDGQGGSVGGKDGLRFAQLVQAVEQLLLGTPFFRNALDDQIGIRRRGLLLHKDVGHKGVLGPLGHFPLGHALLERCVQFIPVTLGGGDAAGVHKSGMAVGGKHLSDAAAHGTGAENCNLHCLSS